MRRSYDHALSSATHQLEPLNYTFRTALATHLSTSAYLIKPAEIEPVGPIEEFHSNNSLWEHTLRSKKLHHGSQITLEEFFIFEWFPRSPGLFWTPNGMSARQQAANRIIKTDDRMIVYDPYGKQSMLDGGIGSIRLKPIALNGREWMLMCASSSGVCHQGFPISCSLHHYKKLIDEIRGRGAAIKTLFGQLKVIPEEIDQLYSGYTDVPKLYLEVEDIKEPRQGKSRRMEGLDVSVAVSFKGEFEGSSGIFATYVTFNPADRDDMKRAVGWMQDTYVTSYKGTVLTDFDQQENHFTHAKFSLKKVMNFQLSPEDFKGIDVGDANIFIERQQITKTIYNVHATNIGNVGDNGSVGVLIQGKPKARRFAWLWPF